MAKTPRVRSPLASGSTSAAVIPTPPDANGYGSVQARLALFDGPLIPGA